MITPESAFGPACFPAAEFSAASAAETPQNEWGRFTARLFTRVSKQTPASIPAQAAGVAIALHESEGVPSAKDLEEAFRADKALHVDIARVANSVHARTRPDADPVMPSEVEGVVFSVFTMAHRLGCLLEPAELEPVKDHFAPLAGNPREYLERMTFECKLDVLARYRADDVARAPEMTTEWLLDSSIDVLA